MRNKEQLKMYDSVTWTGKYKGVFFEIQRWTKESSMVMGYRWNYYIYVKPRKIKKLNGTINYRSMYPDVEFHGGITLLDKITDSNMNIVDKIGCDYTHSTDMSSLGVICERDIEDIKKDIKDTIDSLPKDLFF